MPQFDPVAFKAGTHDQWNNVAEKWDAWGPLIETWLGPATERMLDMAEIGEGARVLHVAGGSGHEAMHTARRVGPSGYVLVTDFSERLIELAEANIKAAGHANIEARVMDGEDLHLPGESFDAVVSRVGLIFFPDQIGSVRQQIAATRHGGHVGAVVYATAEECRFFSDPVGIIRRHAELGPPLPGQPGPFSLGAPGKIEALFEEAGLVDVKAEKIVSPLKMASAAECLRFEQESFGALHQMLSKLDDAGKQAAWDEVAAALRAFETADGFEGPCTMIAAIGRKP
ncbi:MAG: class I SAM-dependent methyltransferase [Geminicoccaceae bacterium]